VHVKNYKKANSNSFTLILVEAMLSVACIFARTPGRKVGDKEGHATSRWYGMEPVPSVNREPCGRGSPSGIARLDPVQSSSDNTSLLPANVAPNHCVKICRPLEQRNPSVLLEDNKTLLLFMHTASVYTKSAVLRPCRVPFGQIFAETGTAIKVPRSVRLPNDSRNHQSAGLEDDRIKPGRQR